MYVPAPVSKVSYGTMVFIRSDIVMNAALYMKKAVTIAIRYNLVRRQSNPDTATGKECQVIDYQHSQRTLFPITNALLKHLHGASTGFVFCL